MQKKIIIFDIDGTLSNLDHRLHLIQQEKPDWSAFHLSASDDKLIEQTFIAFQLMRLGAFHSNAQMRGDYKIEFVAMTGRPEMVRGITQDWFEKHGLKFDRLMMRKNGDYRKDAIIKKEMLDQLREEGSEVLFVVEDRKQVVDMWRENGVMCLQCAEGNY